MVYYDVGMEEPRSQAEINNEEWHNPDNWSDAWLFRAYFSKRDSRMLVPMYFNSKFMPTIPNLGHRWGFAFVILVGAYAMIIVALIGWLVARE